MLLESGENIKQTCQENRKEMHNEVKAVKMLLNFVNVPLKMRQGHK